MRLLPAGWWTSGPERLPTASHPSAARTSGAGDACLAEDRGLAGVPLFESAAAASAHPLRARPNAVLRVLEGFDGGSFRRGRPHLTSTPEPASSACASLSTPSPTRDGPTPLSAAGSSHRTPPRGLPPPSSLRSTPNGVGERSRPRWMSSRPTSPARRWCRAPGPATGPEGEPSGWAGQGSVEPCAGHRVG